jgi:Putative metallopeptidase family (DUF6782)
MRYDFSFCDQPLQRDVDFLVEELSHSVTARKLLSKEVKIVFDSQINKAVLFGKTAAIPSTRSLGETLFALLVLLRRAGQDPSLSPLDHSPDQAIFLNRLLIFDAYSYAIKIAYELKMSGKPEIWKWIMSHKIIGSSARVYELLASEDFRTINNGLAHKKCFQYFFLDHNTYEHDKMLIHHMLFDNYIQKPCKDRIDASAINKLGDLGNGAQYITAQILHNFGGYSCISNKSNANFVWFIKFEKSFFLHAKKMIDELDYEDENNVLPFRRFNTNK